MSSLRKHLQTSASRISKPYSKLTALRKLFIQEKRDWSKPDTPIMGFKRGELFEVANAILFNKNVAEEIGDCGYYLAQSYDFIWELYIKFVPVNIIQRACVKFEKRANDFHSRNS
jgi:NTP pyrophosphatase (non-canonical NTP hydrolase)